MPSETYHDYMLELFKLFNQVYPHENSLSRTQRISKRFFLGIGNRNLAQYLSDQSYSCQEISKSFHGVRKWSNVKVVDVCEPDVYPALPDFKCKSLADGHDKSRLYPYDSVIRIQTQPT